LEVGGGEDGAVNEGEPPAVEGDGAIENMGPDEFEGIVHNVLEALEGE